MKTKTIRQSVTVKTTPHAVYEALMDSRKHGKVTGGPARISRKVGGKFSVFDDYASGVNLELVPDQKIVQTWRANNWPANHESKVTFLLAPVTGGTRLRFTHVGVPEEHANAIQQGWIEFYWTPMKAAFANE